MRIFLRGLPRASPSARAPERSPVSSPCAPAAVAGDGIHARDFEQGAFSNADYLHRPCDSEFRLMQGATTQDASRRATSSLTRGLYFIVHEPSVEVPGQSAYSRLKAREVANRLHFADLRKVFDPVACVRCAERASAQGPPRCLQLRKLITLTRESWSQTAALRSV